MLSNEGEGSQARVLHLIHTVAPAPSDLQPAMKQSGMAVAARNASLVCVG